MCLLFAFVCRLPGTRQGMLERRCEGTEWGPRARLAWLKSPFPHWYTQPESRITKTGSMTWRKKKHYLKKVWRLIEMLLTINGKWVSQTCSYTHYWLFQTLKTKNSIYSWNAKKLQFCFKISLIRCSSLFLDELNWMESYLNKPWICSVSDCLSNTQLSKCIGATC